MSGPGQAPRIGRDDPRELLPVAVRPLRAAMEEEWRRLGLHRGETLGEAVRRGAARFPDCELVFHSEVRPATLTLAELVARAERVAAGWHRRGLVEGDVVAIQMPNWAETAIAYAAAALLGAVFVPIVQIYGPAEVGFILRQSRARALLVPTSFRRLDYRAGLGDEFGDLPDLELLFTVGAEAPAGAVDWGELEAGAEPPCPRPRRGPGDIAAVIYTSGTTARPKGVQHSSDSLLAELHYSPTPPPGEPGTVSLQPFPAGHTAGLCAMLGPIAHGYKTVLLDRWDAEVGVGLVAAHGVTAMAGTPFFIDTLLEAAAGGGDISTLRHGITGGAGVPPSLIERADAVGWRVARCYGATEGPSMTASAATDPLARRARSDGLPLAGNRIRILGEDGAEVASGEEGEIVAIGPEHFVSYSDPEFNEEAFTADGWLRTGDIGRVDADGYLTITDRRKDIIIRGGENISSQEVEDVLVEHPAVRAVAVTGVPDRRYGEIVCAFVVLEPGAALDLEAVRAHFFAAGIARQKTPERLVTVADLPRTAAGKVKKHELRAALAAADGAGVDGS